MDRQIEIREALDPDETAILRVIKAAFSTDEEAELVTALLKDVSAEPRLSLVAFHGDEAIGHILFTAARLETMAASPNCALLAPLSVAPDAQGQGVGGQLIEAGLQSLSRAGTDLVFVLGHPGYYPRHGFAPALRLGFDAPHAIPAEHADAWMVCALRPDIIGTLRGKVACADAISDVKYWRE